MACRRQLEQELFEVFTGKGQSPLSARQLARLTQESNHSVKQIFEARYDEIYLANIPSRKVFEKTLSDLEGIIEASRRTKARSKNKPTPVFQDETYLEHYLELLFTDKEKKILRRLINCNFEHSAEKEGEEDNADTMEVVAYILKGIFGINGKESDPHETNMSHSINEYPSYGQMNFD